MPEPIPEHAGAQRHACAVLAEINLFDISYGHGFVVISLMSEKVIGMCSDGSEVFITTAGWCLEYKNVVMFWCRAGEPRHIS